MTTKAEIERFLAETKLGTYQRVPLGHGLEIYGKRDCVASFQAGMIESIEGKTVLDVGCAYGAMGFLAEEAGASRVLGIDRKGRVIRVARQVSALKESQVEFQCLNIDTHPMPGVFDVVLCYNVLHHLRHPLWVLHNLADACQGWLVLEFSTIKGRFSKLSNVPVSVTKAIENQPMLSPTAREVGLCFNPEALEIIMPWFGSFEMVRSEKSHRSSDYHLMVFRRVNHNKINKRS